MIPDRSLQERLNAVKNGQEIPTPTNNNFTMQNPNDSMQSSNDSRQNNFNIKRFLIIESYKIFNVLTTSILYGYGVKAITFQNWSFLECVGIGIILNHILKFTLDKFKDNKK